MLQEAQVDVSALKKTADADTSQTLIVNVAGQDRRFIHTFGANAGFRADDIPKAQLSKCKVLYVGGFLLMKELRAADLAPVFAETRRHGGKTVLDVVTPPNVDYLTELEQILPHVDLFHANTDEARIMLGESDPLRQAQQLHRLGAKTAVITMGGDGSVLVNADVQLRAGAYPIEFVDGSGGGDAFDAGFIYGMLHGMTTEDCLRYASALGASCVRAIGTTPGVFRRDECVAFLSKHALRIERV
jgi:sugar/nucleoside kinase (ribokinase family)